MCGVAADVSTPAGCEAVACCRPQRRHPRQQCRHLRAQGLFRHPRCRLDALLRDQRDVGRATFARLHARHDRAQLGPHHLHLLGVRPANPQGDDPLRPHQDGAARARARARRGELGHRRHGQLGAARPDALRRRRGIPRGDGQGRRQSPRRHGAGLRQDAPTDVAARTLCHASRRSPTWSSMPPRRKPRLPTALRCASTVASSVRSRKIALRIPGGNRP